MITEKDLIEAIAECQGQRNPNANTCIKLAAFYIILDHVKKKEEESIPTYGYSYASPSTDQTVSYSGDSDFANMINGMDSFLAWSIIDELMDTISVVNPKLYNGVLRKIEGGR